ncbi:unnamed protein product [Musa acuminata subsp. burmannicoides]
MESSSVGDDSKEWDLYLNQDMSFTTNSSEDPLASSSIAAVAFKASLESLWILHYYLSFPACIPMPCVDRPHSYNLPKDYHTANLSQRPQRND